MIFQKLRNAGVRDISLHKFQIFAHFENRARFVFKIRHGCAIIKPSDDLTQRRNSHAFFHE